MKFDIRKKINSNTLIAFTVGVIFAILFNLVVNKDPFKIDSDSISALANVGTFLVAMMAALQVSKWLDGKKKETGFNHTVKILELIEKSHEDLDPLLRQCSDMKAAAKFYGDVLPTVQEKRKLEENINRVDLFCNRLVMSLSMLKYWNMKISDKNDKQVKGFTQSLRTANYILNSINSFPKDTENQINEVAKNHKIAFDYINEFLDSAYDDIFIPITSPVKKDD